MLRKVGIPKLPESLHDLGQAGSVVRELTTVVDNRHVENQKDEAKELFFAGLCTMFSNQYS